ncbi:MAG: type II secretion system F family protein [Alistipes sp.]|nr:type II secretion system F family protein [Alistipes sp.]
MVICMIIATVLSLIFLVLFISADNNIARTFIICNKEIQIENIKNLRIELKLLAEDMKKTNDLTNKKKIVQGKKIKKKLQEAQKMLDAYTLGKISGIDLIPLAGYRMIQILKWDSKSRFIKDLNQKCMQFKEKKEAINYSYYIAGTLIGYVLLGAALFFAALTIGIAFDMGTRSVVVASVIAVGFMLLGYMPYDNVDVIVKKREEEIERQFPQVISKLTLLTVAGMEVSQAWKLASISGKGVLYQEMNRVLLDFDNNVSPVEAYSKFIARCNNNYTTKLATAITQNISKGNAEIVQLFRNLNSESWSEYKHNARRMGEKISGKLLIPTMLMFAGIIIMIIVPVMAGFSF